MYASYQAGKITQAELQAAIKASKIDANLDEANFAGRAGVRPDLVDHLLVGEGVAGKQIKGAHDIISFDRTLQTAGGRVVSEKQLAEGLFEIEYQLPGKAVSTKTVFDPRIYPNMKTDAQIAAVRAAAHYNLTGEQIEKISINGIEYKVPILTPRGKTPYVPTAYPKDVQK